MDKKWISTSAHNPGGRKDVRTMTSPPPPLVQGEGGRSLMCRAPCGTVLASERDTDDWGWWGFQAVSYFKTAQSATITCHAYSFVIASTLSQHTYGNTVSWLSACLLFHPLLPDILLRCSKFCKCHSTPVYVAFLSSGLRFSISTQYRNSIACMIRVPRYKSYHEVGAWCRTASCTVNTFINNKEHCTVMCIASKLSSSIDGVSHMWVRRLRNKNKQRRWI